MDWLIRPNDRPDTLRLLLLLLLLPWCVSDERERGDEVGGDICRGELRPLEPTPAPASVPVNKPGSESESGWVCCRLGKNAPEPCLTNSGFADNGDRGIVRDWGAEFD